MDQLLEEEYKNNIFIDEINVCIAKEHYKEEAFKKTIENSNLDENYFDECLTLIKPLLTNEKLVICVAPILRYETKVYSIYDINSIISINEHLNKNKVVLLYSPIIVNGILKYRSKLL
jgi:hypothetical protein